MRNIIILSVFLSACIGTDVLDDAVDPEIIILNPVEEIAVGASYMFLAEYRDETGMPRDVPLSWESSDPDVISIDGAGNAMALEKGTVEIRVQAAERETSIQVESGDMTSGPVTTRTATLQTSSSYPLEGTATLTKTEGGLILRFMDDFRTTSALPGLYVYLSNNTATTNNAYEVAKVARFTGEQAYSIPDLTSLTDYKYVLFFCKPFVVPVGHGELKP